VAKTKLQTKLDDQALGVLLGRNIAQRRKSLALTQNQLAERLGVETETISRFECGVSLPSLRRLTSLSEVLETSVTELLSQAISNRSDQALMIEHWLQDLSPHSRGYVVESVRQLCEHLSAVESAPR
jgi:transcriptional regulator with XRE-family HTH domain